MLEVSDSVVSLHVLEDHIGPTLHRDVQEGVEPWVCEDLGYLLDGEEGGEVGGHGSRK